MARPKVNRSLAYCTLMSSVVCTVPTASAATSAWATYQASSATEDDTSSRTPGAFSSVTCARARVTS